jgi:hypothetical protein
MIEIHGLTDRQKLLCELMWTCRELSDLDDLINNLPPEDKLYCESLKIIMVQEAIENTFRDKREWDTALALTKALCNRFTLKGKYD